MLNPVNLNLPIEALHFVDADWEYVGHDGQIRVILVQ